MRNIITVMNTKGGVGKSTLVLALADTLSVHHGKKVLVIDSDGHASVSNMLTPHAWLEAMQAQGRTIVDYLIAAVLGAGPVNWCEFTVSGVSDVDDAHSIDLLPGGGHLTLFEREVSRCESEGRLRRTIRSFLADVRGAYDFVLIDSAPGLSVLTECWLREADYCLSPTKPDYISIRGLQFLGEFRQRDPHIGFAEWLGVVINLKDQQSPADEHFDRWLRQDARKQPRNSARTSAPTGRSTRARPARTCAISPAKCSAALRRRGPDPRGKHSLTLDTEQATACWRRCGSIGHPAPPEFV
jgi:chromosome partitioning protein